MVPICIEVMYKDGLFHSISFSLHKFVANLFCIVLTNMQYICLYKCKNSILFSGNIEKQIIFNEQKLWFLVCVNLLY